MPIPSELATSPTHNVRSTLTELFGLSHIVNAKHTTEIRETISTDILRVLLDVNSRIPSPTTAGSVKQGYLNPWTRLT